MVGHKAKIILRPSLSIVNERVSLARLGKSTLKVTTTNSQQISNSTLHENITFKDTQDFILEIPVKSYISRVRIDLESEVEKIDKTKQKLSSAKDIAIDLEEGNNNFVDSYLEKKGTSYILTVKGKNGEPIPEVPASFSY